jgi:hypothetical protein
VGVPVITCQLSSPFFSHQKHQPMKHLIFIACILWGMLLPLLSRAQSEKEMTAIANFQLAEEAYDNREYSKGLNYLEEAKKSVGNKPKLLYLQIMIEQEMINDAGSIQKLLNLIAMFENANGIDNFSNEKKMLVAKNKVLLQEKLTQQLAKEEKQKEEQIALEKKQKAGNENFETFTIQNLPFGLTVEEFQKRYPHILPENFKKEKAQTEGIDVEVYYPKSIYFEHDDKGFNLPYNASSGNPVYDTSVYAVLVKDGRVIGFKQTLFYYNSKGKGSLDWNSALSKKFSVYGQFLELFAFAPDSNNVDYWNWRKDGDTVKSVRLLADAHKAPNGNKWKSSLNIRVINFSK